MQHVVIVGGGFGGMYATKALKRAPVRVTLLDRRNFHLFQPLLYQVATGGLSPGDIASPLRWVVRKQKNTHVFLGEVLDFDVANRRLIVDNGEIFYDSLIVAAGATHHYFGHPEWEHLAPGLKTIEDATEIRRRVLLAFEGAERESDPIKRLAWLTFVVVGAGPTGVELAGTLGEIANDTMRSDFRTFNPGDARILLLDGAPRVLPLYPPPLSGKAERQLIRLGVRTLTGVRVVGVDEDGVTMQSEHGEAARRIETKTVIWAAGVDASRLGGKLAAQTGAQVDRAGRVVVGPDLTVPGHPEIFVIGDLAAVQQDGKPVPGVAPAAMQMGTYAASVVEAREKGAPPPPPFRYHDKGSLATIGRAAAVADFGKLRFSGHFAWLLWLFVHLMYLVGFENRLIVFIKWGMSYLTYNRGARLITGGRAALPPLEVPRMGTPEIYEEERPETVESRR